MLSATDSGKISGGCNTIAIWRRSELSVYSRISTPSIVTAPLDRIEESRQQPEQRRFAGAGRADDRDFRPGRDRDVDVVQHRRLGTIAETDIAPGDVVAHAARRKLPRPARQVGLGFQHLENPRRADPRRRDQAPALRDLVDRLIQLRQIGNEDEQLPQRQIARTARRARRRTRRPPCRPRQRH